ncbi:lipoprotein LpqH [Mycobacterium sp. 21AC1]|uniref:lipoprotein LpqH n=1 Tax=[Mycobacterium] appelbergii TaxID=2939269 RepID=UPI0029392310|nr:lipoprotein LpqH [Mycobacterium sp. 21AC1]MDV3124730.1 lipoprotein LpqH [Mycobacterium sp. 21AC1]
MLVVSACSTTNGDLLNTNTVEVTLNGEQVPIDNGVQCHQLEWMWTIESVQQEPGFTAIVETGDSLTGKIVRLRGLDGFTGSAIGDSGDDIKVDIDGFTYIISGTAHGSYADHPVKQTTADFRIRADC